MKNSTSTKPLGTLETEGLALAKAWRSRDRKDKNQFNVDIRDDGQFDPSQKRPSGLLVRTGFIMSQIKINNTTLELSGLKNLDRRRRSECHWFYENHKDCLEFISKSKKGYTNLSALQKAMAKANKQPKVDDQETDPSEATDSKATTSEAKQSDIGQLPVTKYDLAKAIMKTCQDNEINPLDLIDIILINVENQPKQPKNVVSMGSHKVDSGWKKVAQANA